MTRLPRVVCRGAPRDLGLDQGRAWGEAIRKSVVDAQGGWLARFAFRWTPPARVRAVGRDTFRFFPHMAERSAGLALGARVSALSLAALAAQPEPSLAGALRIVRTERGPCVARAIASGTPVLLRESVPDSDYRSIELVDAARIAPWVGVNQHGLAVGASFLAAGDDPCAAPASLLAQDCLQRFDRVDKAVEWLERRPAGGRALIALADAAGACAVVEIDGRERKQSAVVDAPLTPATAARSWVIAAEPATRALSWTFEDGSSGEAALG